MEGYIDPARAALVCTFGYIHVGEGGCNRHRERKRGPQPRSAGSGWETERDVSTPTDMSVHSECAQ